MSTAMFKKTPLLAAYSSVQSCSVCSPHCGLGSSTSPCDLSTRRVRPATAKRRRLSEPPLQISRRSYATVRDSSGMDFRDNMNWPRKKTASQNPFVPSPYEIFDMHRSASYCRATKLKYFELVKIYHPDRSSQSVGCEGLSHGERLERVSEQRDQALADEGVLT